MEQQANDSSYKKDEAGRRIYQLGEVDENVTDPQLEMIRQADQIVSLQEAQFVFYEGRSINVTPNIKAKVVSVEGAPGNIMIIAELENGKRGELGLDEALRLNARFEERKKIQVDAEHIMSEVSDEWEVLIGEVAA